MIIFTLNRRLGFLLNRRKRLFAALWFLLNRRKGFNALLSLKPRWLFISFARTKETKQRKFAVCTFLPTPALFSAKQKELASLKQLFVFYAPKSTFASRQKSEAGPLCFFYATSLRSLGCDVFFFLLRSFLSSRAERRISFTSTPRAKRCALQRGLFPASVEEREEKSSIFR